MKGRMRVAVPRLGDKEVVWDTEVQETVDEARREFMERLEQSYFAYEVGGEQSVAIAEFNPNALEIVLMLPLKGG